MRVTIIGIDGLDYNIVGAMELKNLEQEHCGKLTIPKECYSNGICEIEVRSDNDNDETRFGIYLQPTGTIKETWRYLGDDDYRKSKNGPDTGSATIAKIHDNLQLKDDGGIEFDPKKWVMRDTNDGKILHVTICVWRFNNEA